MPSRPTLNRTGELLAHADWLFRLAAHLVGPDAVDDVLQETWVVTLRSPPQRDQPVRPWLATVLRNMARRRARAASRRAIREAESAPVFEDNLGGSADVLLEQAETSRLLAESVLALREPYRGTILLRYYDGYTAATIASIQKVPAATARWRLRRL